MHAKYYSSYCQTMQLKTLVNVVLALCCTCVQKGMIVLMYSSCTREITLFSLLVTQVKELKAVELEDGDRLHALERRAAHYWEEAMMLLSRLER